MLALGLAEAVALGDALGLALAEGDREALTLALSETLAEGETDADTDALGETLADGTPEGLIPRCTDSDCAAVSWDHDDVPVVVPAHVPVMIAVPPPAPAVTDWSLRSVIDARFAFVTVPTFVESAASSEKPTHRTIRESAVTVIDGVRTAVVVIPWSAAVPTTMFVVTFTTPWSAMTSIAPEQWSPTPLTVTSPAEFEVAILAKIVSVLHAGSVDDPAANVCSKILANAPLASLGSDGVPAVVVESVDSMTMIIRSP